MRRIILFLSCFLAFAISVISGVKSAAKNVVELIDSTPFSQQVSRIRENTTIVVKYDFDLKKGTVIIPKNCILRFEGGALSNGTICFQKTGIEGYPEMDVIPQGTISGTVNAAWFGLKEGDPDFDNGSVLNRVGQVFSDVFVDAGDYYCKTPIDWSNNVIKSLTVKGNLRFKSPNTSSTFITLKTTRGVVSFEGSIVGPTQRITEKTPKEKSTGICFMDCNNSKIFVKSIGMFYRNIRVLGSSAAKGNAYNDYEFIESYSAKVLVHIDTEKGGWVASNIYRILRLTGYGGQTVPETALLIKGEDTDKNGNFSDTVIEKLCIEGLKQSEPIKIVGAHHFVIKNIRNEGNYPVLCYCQNVLDGRISSNYGSVTVRAENASKVAILSDDELDVYEPLANSYVIDSDGRMRLFNCVDANLNSLVRNTPLSYTPVGIVVSKSVLNKPLRIQGGDLFTLDVVYYDENWRIIPYEETSKMMPSGNVFFKKSNVVKGAYMTSSSVRDLCFVCSEGNSRVAYVGLFLRSHGSTASPAFRVSRLILSAAVQSVMEKQQYKPYLSAGPTKSRPVFSPEDAKYNVGYQYFDTSIGKSIYARSISEKGVAVWVDSDGKQL